MDRKPFISLCVPTYNRIHFLTRLLNSIATQTFKDFEIIITDNSSNDSVFDLVKQYPALPINYHKNIPATNMTTNWNINVSRANGTWIKMIHDDDWFMNDDSLAQFAAVAAQSDAKFISCSWQTVREDNGEKNTIRLTDQRFEKIIKNPFLIYGHNLIGPPSAVMVHHSVATKYDNRMNWLVDVDYYLNVLLNYGPCQYIAETLVNISYHDQQATKTEFNNRSSEISESLMLWGKHGTKMIREMINYDSWWRMIRNLRIKSMDEFKQYSADFEIPFFMQKMIGFQSRLPAALLSTGVSSKLFMAYSYYFHFKGRKA